MEDFKNKKFVLNVTTYPKDHFANPKENPKKNEKQEVEPFFSGETKTNEGMDSTMEVSLEEKYETFVEAIRKSGKGAKLTLTPNDIIVEFGFDYPDELAQLAFEAAGELGISSRELSVCAESSGHKAIKIDRVNGGPKNWNMLNRYGRR